MRCFGKVLTISWCVLFASLLGAPTATAADDRLASAKVSSSPTPAPLTGAAVSAQQTDQRYGDLPLSFEANQGQTDPQVRFLSRGSGYSFFLTQTGAVLTFSRDSQSSAALRMQLAGASPSARINGLDELPGKSNYFSGSDSSRWRTGVPAYSRIAYENIYPGISLVYYGNQRQLEYDFVVAPGADPRQIRLNVAGAKKLTVDSQGNLVLRNSAGEVQLLAPRVYQQTNGQKQEIAGQWKLEASNVAGFRLGRYDHTRALIIDPVLQYSSFLGGSQKNSLSKIAIDAAGNAYVAGYTASGDFPAAPTPQAQTFGPGPQSRGAFVAKIDPSGSNLLYSTYLSGSSDEEATGLAVDAQGNVYLAGNTHSVDFPTRNAFQSTCATHTNAGTCSSAFLTKISPTGDALLFSTYLGASGGESARGLAVDASGSAYIAGVTSSVDFPVTSGSAQVKCAGTCEQNTFIAKFSPAGDKLAYATYLGGSASDDAADLAVDASGNAYIAGHTTSPDFPLATPYQKSCSPDATSTSGACVATAFITKLKSDGSAFVYSTYLGGSLGSEASAIAVDSLGNAYVAGRTQSSDFPLVKAFQKTCGIDSASGKCSIDAFLTKFAPTGKALIYSTYLGGSGRDQASGIAVDAFGNAHIVGTTESSDFPTVSSAQSKLKGSSDAFAARFNPSGSALTFSTYHGGSATESGNALALDAKGNLYLAGETTSPDFPTHHAFQSSCAGACTSAFVTKMSLPPPANSAPTITSVATATFTVGTNGSFTVTTTGTPTPSISDGGFSLPSAVTFTDNGDGTGTLTGIPATGTGGAYTFTFTATNGVAPDATQSFTLNVDEAPTVIGATSLTCTVGTSCSTIMSTTGFPTPSLTAAGALPSGLTFTDNGDGTGTLGGTAAAGSGGVYTTVVINASNSVGPAPGHPVNPVTINEAASFLSTNATTFTVGTAGAFTVTTRGFPRPALTETGALPTGVTFVDNGNGTAKLSGTPATGTGGTYTLTFKGVNTINTATQTFTLTVDEGPAITSANNTTFTVGTAGTFTVTATGSPAPTLSETGALPTGVTFTAGTGVLAGTPAAGTGGTYSITFKATNTAGTISQTFTLTVDEAPAITSANNTTFVVGSLGSFTVTATGAPAPTFTETGALPTGVTLTAAGLLSGTPAAGTAGTYVITLKATNTVGNITQSFTLHVNEGPVITSTNNTTFTVGTAGTFTVTATGTPAPTLSETGALPTGVTFTAATGVLAGTPAVGTGGVYSISFKATNTVGAITQAFTLTVNEGPVITSSNSTTFVVGTAGSFSVTASGTPAPTFTETGTLPSGVTFGGHVLSGTPAVGTGGTYPITFKATNGIGTDASQSFTLTVHEAPAITSTNSLACQVLVPCTLTITTNPTANPVPTLSETPALPTGITLTDNGNGTGTLAGTPALGTGGVYSLSLKATNSVATATQPFTLTIADFTASVTGAPVTVIQGLSGSATLTLTAQSNYAGTITPACPTGSLCAFNPTTVTLPNGGSNSATSIVMVGSTNNMPVGNYSVNVTSTDSNGDLHTVSVPYTVECTYALTSPAFTPLTSGAATTYPFAVTVSETSGGLACPWTATATSGFTFSNGTATISGTDANNASPVPATFSLPANTSVNPVTSSMQVTFFAAPTGTGTLPFSAVQEATQVVTNSVIAGGSTQVTLSVSGTPWSQGSTIQYISPVSGSSVCGVVGPNGTLDAGFFGITCAAPTGTTLPAAPQLTITTSPTTVAMHRPFGGTNAVASLYGIALGVPALLFIGGLTGKKARRNRLLLRALGVLTLIFILALLSSCGGGINATIRTVGNSNNFTVTVMGTVMDSSGNIEGVEIQTVSLPVAPQP